MTLRRQPVAPLPGEFVFPLLVILSVIMILLSKVDETAFLSWRASLADIAAPTLDALSRPLAAAEDLIDRARAILTVYQENVQLREENGRLLHWQQAALTLASENAQLRELMKLVPAAAVSFVTARVIANSGGAYVRDLMVDAGSDVPSLAVRR